MAVSTRDGRTVGKHPNKSSRHSRRRAERYRRKVLMIEFLERREMLDASGLDELFGFDESMREQAPAGVTSLAMDASPEALLTMSGDSTASPSDSTMTGAMSDIASPPEATAAFSMESAPPSSVTTTTESILPSAATATDT